MTMKTAGQSSQNAWRKMWKTDEEGSTAESTEWIMSGKYLDKKKGGNKQLATIHT